MHIHITCSLLEIFPGKIKKYELSWQTIHNIVLTANVEVIVS